MLAIRAWHLISMVAWFSGLFYLPRLFVYHVETAEAEEPKAYQRFCKMEHRLYYWIMMPSGLLNIALGLILLHGYAWTSFGHMFWLQAKLVLLVILCVFHVYCMILVNNFKQRKNTHSGKYFRILNEVPTPILIAIVLLAVYRPVYFSL